MVFCPSPHPDAAPDNRLRQINGIDSLLRAGISDLEITVEEIASLKARLRAAQARELALAAKADEAQQRAVLVVTQVIAERDRWEEIVIGAMRHALRDLRALEWRAAREEAYRSRLGLSDALIERLDPAALAVERIRRNATQRETA